LERIGLAGLIAVVEDEPELQILYRLVLTSRGYRIAYMSASADDAVNSYAQCPQKPDLVIMDQRLDDSSGIDAARRIVEMHPEARIMFATAEADQCLAAEIPGTTGVLQKPFSMSELFTAIERALTREESGFPRRPVPSFA
jgi:DNA-binding response OmpR family regulator